MLTVAICDDEAVFVSRFAAMWSAWRENCRFRCKSAAMEMRTCC